eukprot:gene66646-91256_t
MAGRRHRTGRYRCRSSSPDQFGALFQNAVDPVPVSGDTPCSIMFTSGTTSLPKGVVWTQANMVWAARTGAKQFALRHDDVTLLTLPLFHVVGFSGHRSVENPAGISRAITTALESLRKEAPGEWLALSSVADGSDQMFVARAHALGLSWHAILPLPKAEFQKDFSAADWNAVETMLTQAEHVRVITENGTREDAYLDCGMETVNGAD